MNRAVATQLLSFSLASAACLLVIPRLVNFALPEELKMVDTSRVGETAFGTEPKVVVYGRDLIDPAANNVLLLGASNVREGVRLAELSDLPPHWKGHCLAIGASNITQIRQVTELLDEFPLGGPTGKNVVVLGIWYGLFVDNLARWKGGPTAIETEQLRYGVYGQKQAQVLPRFPPLLVPESVRFVHHGLRVYQVLERWRTGLLDAPTEGGAAGVDLDAPLVDESKREAALTFWRDYFGGAGTEIKDEQFLELKALVERVQAKRWHVVLVDMPLPRWHANRSPLFADYQSRKIRHLQEFKTKPLFTYVNLQDLNASNMFYDSAHPRPRFSQVWGKRVSGALRKILTL